MKRNKANALRPSLAVVLVILGRQYINRAAVICAAIYRAIEKRKPLLKLWRWELRTGYAVAAFMDRYPRLTNAFCVVLYVVFCLEMFVGCMDALCGIE